MYPTNVIETTPDYLLGIEKGQPVLVPAAIAGLTATEGPLPTGLVYSAADNLALAGVPSGVSALEALALATTYPRSFVLAQRAGIEITVAASTFTTLTATNPAGATTRLTSAGAHGLTAANDGQYIWVSAAAGITAGLYALTYVNANAIDIATTSYSALTTPVVGLEDAQNEIFSVSVPAGMMGAKGQVEVDFFLEISNTATAKSVILNFGGSAASETIALNGTTVYQRRLQALIANQNDAAKQRISAFLAGSDPTTQSKSLTKNTANAQTIQITSLLTAAAEFIRISGLRVVVWPAA